MHSATKYVCILFAVSFFSACNESPQPLQRVLFDQVAADKALEAKESERQAIFVKQCTENVADLITKATSELKGGDPDKALQTLDYCKGILTNTKALGIKAAARTAANKKASDASKREIAAAEKERKQLLAEKKRHGVSIGMTAQNVLDSSWGRPASVNRTTNAQGVSEQWVYAGGYLYLEDGVLTAIQN